MNSENNFSEEMEEVDIKISEPLPKKSRSRYFLIIGILIVVISLGALTYEKVLSPAARTGFYIAHWQNYFDKVQSAHRNDKYGGKTPDETLSLFIQALEKDDLRLASKYFVLDKDGNRNPMWLEGLNRLKSEGKMAMVIGDLKKAKVVEKSERLNYWYYAIYGENNSVTKTFDIKKDNFSNLWKIGGM